MVYLAASKLAAQPLSPSTISIHHRFCVSPPMLTNQSVCYSTISSDPTLYFASVHACVQSSRMMVSVCAPTCETSFGDHNRCCQFSAVHVVLDAQWCEPFWARLKSWDDCSKSKIATMHSARSLQVRRSALNAHKFVCQLQDPCRDWFHHKRREK